MHSDFILPISNYLKDSTSVKNEPLKMHKYKINKNSTHKKVLWTCRFVPKWSIFEFDRYIFCLHAGPTQNNLNIKKESKMYFLLSRVIKLRFKTFELLPEFRGHFSRSVPESFRTIKKHQIFFSQHRCIFDMHPGWPHSILKTTIESKLNY